MRPWEVIKYTEDETLSVISDAEASSEVIAEGKVSVYGQIKLSDSSPFYIKYYVNERFFGATTQSYSYIAALQFLNSAFSVGDNYIRIELYNIQDEVIFELKKLVVKNYYDYVWFFNYKEQQVTSLDFTLYPKGKLYLGMQQENINFVLSELCLTITCPAGAGEQVLHIAPILSHWEPHAGVDQPEVWDEIGRDYTLTEGENILNLVELLISGYPIYGLCLTGENVRFDYSFQKCQQQYYIVYIRRPRIVYNDRVTISWEDVKFKYKDSFEKFELLKDGTPIFETEDFDTRSYTDDTLEVNKTYMYQLRIYVKAPRDVVWQFTQQVADLWKQTDDKNLEFYPGDLNDLGEVVSGSEEYLGIKSLPINVKAKFSNPNEYTDYKELNEGEGFIVTNLDGRNIYKEFFVEAQLDFSDRVTITKLLDQSGMDTALSSIVEKATFVKKLGDGYMWRFKMHKRTRALEYSEEEKS